MSAQDSVVTWMYMALRMVHPGSLHSWRKVNDSLESILRQAIRAQMRFGSDDIRQIYNGCRGEHWFSDGEWILREACLYGNASAAASFLSWKGRLRFKWPSALIVDTHPILEHEAHKRKQLGLLYVGASFLWKASGEDEHHIVVVTSFAQNGRSLIACRYAEEPTVLARRYDLLEARRTLLELATLEQDVDKAASLRDLAADLQEKAKLAARPTVGSRAVIARYRIDIDKLRAAQGESG